MHETRNNCFGSKKRSTTLLQAKTGKHECWNVTAFRHSFFVLTWFRLKEGRDTFFQPETIVASFLHLMVLFFKVLLNNSSINCPCRLRNWLPSRRDVLRSFDFTTLRHSVLFTKLWIINLRFFQNRSFKKRAQSILIMYSSWFKSKYGRYCEQICWGIMWSKG